MTLCHIRSVLYSYHSINCWSWQVNLWNQLMCVALKVQFSREYFHSEDGTIAPFSVSEPATGQPVIHTVSLERRTSQVSDTDQPLITNVISILMCTQTIHTSMFSLHITFPLFHCWDDRFLLQLHTWLYWKPLTQFNTLMLVNNYEVPVLNTYIYKYIYTVYKLGKKSSETCVWWIISLLFQC